jgi:hypothetical protein
MAGQANESFKLKFATQSFDLIDDAIVDFGLPSADL